MTSENIRVDAQLMTGLQINAVTARTWVFDAVKYIARHYPLACPKKTVTFTAVVPHDEYQIEDELVRIDKICESGEFRPITAKFYEADELGNISFAAMGTYDITYRYVPDLESLNESSQLPIPDRFAEAIKYYVSARIRGRIFGQGDSDAQNYDALFGQYVMDANITMQGTNRRQRRLPPRI